ncbi:MAG: hypothetical protein ACREQA_12315 [Candidatus Binatia bacterium]
MRVNLSRFWSVIAVILCVEVALVAAPWEAKAQKAEQIALLKGADRQKVLEQGARKEGKLLWYSTLIDC